MHKKMVFTPLLLSLSLLALSLSSWSTKAAGLAWLVWVLAGLGAWWQGRTTSGVLDQATNEFAKIWLVCAALALAFRVVPMLYWHDRWDERHAEIRLLLGAMGTYGLCRLGLPLVRWHPQAMVGAVSISCALALVLMLWGGRDAAPTNAIPWATGVALCGVWLWAMASDLSGLNRLVCVLGAFLGLCAVLTSETRGAYGLLVLWLLTPLVYAQSLKGLFTTVTAGWFKRSRFQMAAMALATAVGLGVFAQSSVVQRPWQRMQEASQEVAQSQESLDAGANSSVGARLYMWRHSLGFIAQSVWLGHGQTARKQAIAQWGQEAKSETVLSLGHAHNEYLHALMDHGLWGLASLLSYAVGMVWLCIRMFQTGARTQAWAVGGVLFMHSTAGLTNVNFAHNYYPTMLSIVMGLILLSLAWRAQPAQCVRA